MRNNSYVASRTVRKGERTKSSTRACAAARLLSLVRTRGLRRVEPSHCLNSARQLSMSAITTPNKPNKGLNNEVTAKSEPTDD